MLGWGGGDVNVPCTCTHVGCYARCWVGVGGTVNWPCTCTHVGCYARCWVGVGGMLTYLALAHKSSTVCFSLHELLQRTAAKSLLERKWSTKCGAILMISCPSPSIISPKQPDWSMIRSGSICTVGNGDKMRARTCGPTCTKCLLSEKKPPLIRYSNSSAPLTRTPPCLFARLKKITLLSIWWGICRFFDEFPW